MTLQLKLGERLHNPLDLEGDDPWRGRVGVVEGKIQFDNDLNGIRAGAIDIHNKVHRDGLDTFRKIVAKFAPEADGNDEVAYVKDLVDFTKIGGDDVLDLDEVATLQLVVSAFIHHEQGRVIYAPGLVLQACLAALEHVHGI